MKRAGSGRKAASDVSLRPAAEVGGEVGVVSLLTFSFARNCPLDYSFDLARK